MIEQITDKMYMGEPVKDDRPLTYEILEELGFEWSAVWSCYELEINGIGIESWKSIDNEIVVDIDALDGTKRVWKTVGKVKMLIEALKGDE